MIERKDLREHISMLARMEESDAPVVSLYVDTAESASAARETVWALARNARRSLPAALRKSLDEGVRRADSFLKLGVGRSTKGVAMFTRAGQTPVFKVLEFAVPAGDALSIGWAPDIYHLLELEQSYCCYVLAFTSREAARVAAVELPLQPGAEPLEKRLHRSGFSRTSQFVCEQARVVEQMMAAAAAEHWILAGDRGSTARLAKAAPEDVAQALSATLDADAGRPWRELLEAGAEAFHAHRERQDAAHMSRLRDRFLSTGLAATGTRATVEAVRNGSADSVTMARSYAPAPGLTCRDCGAVEWLPEGSERCRECRGSELRAADLKQELVRLAVRNGTEIRIVRADETLMHFGGVGCLLRDEAVASESALLQVAGMTAAATEGV